MTRTELQEFCAPFGEGRDQLEMPWRDGDYVYASNGQIILRVRADVFPIIQPRDRAPKMSSWDFDEITRWKEWSKIPEELPDAKTEPCPTCQGSTHHFCGDCETVHDCGKCKGKGIKTTPAGVRIGAATIDSRPLKVLATLPGIRIQQKWDEPSCPRFFKSDEGDGFIATTKAADQ